MSPRKIILLIFVLALLLRGYPLFIGSMTGPDPWFHARMAEMVVEGQAVPTYDELSMQGRFYSYAPLYHTTIATFSIASSIDVLSLTPILPLIYGAMAVFLVFAFAKRFFKSDSIALFAALAIAIMPLHLMRSASYARPDTLALLLVPTVIFLIYINRFKLAGLLTVALALLHPLSALYLFLFLIVWMVIARISRTEFKFRNTVLLILIGTLVWLLWLYSLPYSPAEYVSMVSFESAENAKPLILSIAVLFTFSWIFAAIGIAKIKARENIFLLSWFGFSFLYAAFSMRLAIFLTIPMAILASFGFGVVFEKTRKFAPILFLILFVLSSMVLYNEVQGAGWFISPPERSAISWMSSLPDETVIACRWDRGHPITYLSGKPVVMDGYFEFAPGLDERNKSMSAIPYISNCDRLLAEQQKWGFTHFFVPSRSFGLPAFTNGLLAADCNFISQPFSGSHARILEFG